MNIYRIPVAPGAMTPEQLTRRAITRTTTAIIMATTTVSVLFALAITLLKF